MGYIVWAKTGRTRERRRFWLFGPPILEEEWRTEWDFRGEDVFMWKKQSDNTSSRMYQRTSRGRPGR